MTHHSETTGTSGPDRADDPLARAVVEAVTGLRPPPARVDLERVRRRGRRRRALRRTALAVPAAAAALVLAGALWTPGTPSTSTAPAPPAGTTSPAPSDPATPTPARSADPQRIARAVFRDALLSIDPDLNRYLAVEAMSDGGSGQPLGWWMTYQDPRSTPDAALTVQISRLVDELPGSERTSCAPQAQCTDEQLPGGIRLLTARTLDTRLVREDQAPGGQLQGWHTSVTTVYPDGRLVSADTRLEASSEAELAAGRSFDSPLISTAQLQALVTNPAFAGVPWP
ncbi:hypothetical protein [Kineococcus sp. SYSU DK006]|uniref:hypothetical protein n=1 Tax=Kineococcus sp. SYSU DK006 TaxID=3383127 RepID=UPI003D7C893B